MVLWNVLTNYHQLQHGQGFLLCITQKVMVTRVIRQIYPILGSTFVCHITRYSWTCHVYFSEYALRTWNISIVKCFSYVVHHVGLVLIYQSFQRAILVRFLSVFWQEPASSFMVLHVLLSDQLEIPLIIVFWISMWKSMHNPSVPDIFTPHPEVTQISCNLAWCT